MAGNETGQQELAGGVDAGGVARQRAAFDFFDTILADPNRTIGD
jgi:hypothetical protein